MFFLSQYNNTSYKTIINPCRIRHQTLENCRTYLDQEKKQGRKLIREATATAWYALEAFLKNRFRDPWEKMKFIKTHITSEYRRITDCIITSLV